MFHGTPCPRDAAAFVAANERRRSTPDRASWDLAKTSRDPERPLPQLQKSAADAL
jgi:hypothetical protein